MFTILKKIGNLRLYLSSENMVYDTTLTSNRKSADPRKMCKNKMGNNCGGNFGEREDKSPSSKYEANGGELDAGNSSNMGHEEQKKPVQKTNETNANSSSEDAHANGSEEHPRDNKATQNNSNIGGSSVIKWVEGHQYYKMDNTHRGLALIFNHYEFDHHTIREGTHCDEERLRVVLNNLGFDVKSHTDLTYEEICAVIQEAQEGSYKDSDCLVLAVLSHGNLGGLLAAKDVDYPFHVLWEQFTDDNCPSLKGKPRLFFVQACRGNQVMDPVMLIYRTHTDSTPYSPIPNIPEHFLVAYATTEGYFSWRTDSGTWFIQSLCQMLEKYAYQDDINLILTRVLRDVAIGYETNTPILKNGEEIGIDHETHEKKQMPCVVTKLTRLLLFKKKLY